MQAENVCAAQAEPATAGEQQRHGAWGPFSRASTQRQSQVRGDGMGAVQGIEGGTRVACNICRRPHA
jgi:hypothetical protein